VTENEDISVIALLEAVSKPLYLFGEDMGRLDSKENLLQETTDTGDQSGDELAFWLLKQRHIDGDDEDKMTVVKCTGKRSH